MENSNTKKYILVLILVTITLRLITFAFPYVNIDETDYSLAARIILDGGLPYKDFLIYQPPVIYYIYTLGFWISGGINLFAVHIITIGFVLGTVLTLFALAKDILKSSKAGFLAGIFYALFSTAFFPMDMLASNCEILMMFPMSLGAYFLYKYSEKNKLIYALFSGIMIGIGVLTKYQGGILLIAALFYLSTLRPLLQKHFSFKKHIVPAIILSLGFILPLTSFSLYLYKSGAFMYAYEALRYILLYSKGPVQSSIDYVAIKFAIRTIIFGISGIAIWLGAIIISAKYLFSSKNRKTLPEFTIFLVVWFLLSVIPIIMGGRIYFHYYFVILPPVCLLASIWWTLFGIRKRALKIILISWSVFCILGWQAFAIHTAMSGPRSKETWVHTADYIKKIAQPDDTMFIWGCAYQIYFYSNLKPGTRFTSADYLTGRSPMTAGLEFNPDQPNPPSTMNKIWHDFVDRPGIVVFDTAENIFPKAWEYFKEDMEKKLPTYIIDTSPSNYRRYGRYPIKKYPYLYEIIKNKYDLLTDINGYKIYKLQ